MLYQYQTKTKNTFNTQPFLAPLKNLFMCADESFLNLVFSVNSKYSFIGCHIFKPSIHFIFFGFSVSIASPCIGFS